MSDCALWYWQYGAADYELFENEQDAVKRAWSMSEYGEAAIAGIQFADGRLLERDHWPAYAAYSAEQMAKYAEEAKNRPKPVKIGTVTEPFEGQQTVNVWDWDEPPPEWLGKQ